MDALTIIVSMLGGLALFLYGMGIMSGTLSRLTGGSLDRVIGKITQNRYVGFAAGAALTALVQSSSATTVLTVGFVNAGIMKLREAFGFVVGANLGATMNAWILSLNSVEGGTLLLKFCKPTFFVPLVAFISVMLAALSKRERNKTIASALIGFCVMMTGMMLMSQAIAPLKSMPAFNSMLTSFENPFIAFLASLAFTMVIQSSDATVGILQAIAMSAVLTRGMAIPLVCGAQVGTCVTAMLSSLGTSNNGKRTALLHLYYNLLKTIPFLIVLFSINAVRPIPGLNTAVTGMWIPLFHTMINIAAAIVFLPLSGLFVKLAELTIPYNEKEKQEQENVLTMLEPKLLVNPAIAVTQVKKAILELAGTVFSACNMMSDQANDNEEGRNRIRALCTRSTLYRDQILSYLQVLSAGKISEEKIDHIQCGQNICISLARIGELIEGILDILSDMHEKQMHFSDVGRRDVFLFAEAVREIVDTTVINLEMGNLSLSDSIGLFRQEVSEFHGIINSRHIKRLHDGICKREDSIPFMDICYSLEKVIDSCDMVAHNIRPFQTEDDEISEEEKKIREKKKEEYIRNLFKDKYMELNAQPMPDITHS